MAKKSQIKNVLIKTSTQGSKEALKELNAIDSSIESINKQASDLIGKSRTMAKAFGSVSQATKGFERTASSIAEVGKSLNTAFSGNARQTKAIDSYATNLEFLQSVMKEFNTTAAVTEKHMSSISNTFNSSPMMKMASSMEIMIGQLQEMIEQLDDLNAGSRITNARLKQARDYIADVGQAADLTNEQFEDLARGARKYGGQIDKSDGAVRKHTNGLRRMNAEGRSTTKGFSDIVFGTNPLVNAYAAIAVNVFAASEAFRLLNEAASFDRLQEQLASFSAGVSGINVRDLSRDLEEASGHALTFKEAIGFATSGTAFNFTSEQMIRLTELTRKASIALGRDFADSMERVTKGIAKQEIEVLDEIGVVTRLETAFAKFAPTIGKTIDQLTEYERQVALTNEVMGQLEEKYNGINADATPWEMLSASIRNVTQDGLSLTQEFLAPVVGYMDEVIRQAYRLRDAQLGTQTSLEDQNKTFNEAYNMGNYAEAITSVGGLTNKIEELKGRQRELIESTKEVNQQYKNSDFLGRLGMDTLSSMYNTPVLGLATSGLKDSAAAIRVKNLEEQKQTTEQLRIAEQRLEEQTKKLAHTLGIDVSKMTELTGQKIKTFNRTLVESARAVTKVINENKKALGPYAELRTEIGKMTKGSDEFNLTAEASAKAFAELSDSAELAGSISSLDELKTFLTQANDRALSLSQTLSVFNESNESNADTKVGALALELQLLERINADNQKAGNLRSKQYKKEIIDKIELTKLKLESAKRDRDILEYTRAINLESSLAIMNAEHNEKLESSIIAISIDRLQKERDKLYAMGKQTKELDDQLVIEKERLRLTKEKEAAEKDKADIDIRIAANQSAAQKAIQNERAQIEYAQNDLDLRYEKALLIKNELEQQQELLKIGLEQEKLNLRKLAATSRQAQAAFSQLQGLNGLSGLQQDFLSLGEGLSKSFADAAEHGVDSFSKMIDYLGEDASRLTAVGITVTNALGSMYQSLTEQKIAGIDREIEAEQRRDGKSKESLEKIKKLEAKKIKENAKASKAQVIMSTSVAIMRAFQDFGIYGAIPAAIMAGMGAMQISQINAASNGQLAALNAGGVDGMTITGGHKGDNRVDVGSSASAGESGFMAGLSLPGRSGGGRVESGDAITLGEVGPEVFIPDVPGTVVPAGRSETGVSLGGIEMNINAIDSKSLLDQIDVIRGELFDRIDEELAARHNTSLDRIG